MASRAATVLIVSDYGGRAPEEWAYLRATLAAVAGQDFDEPYEAILVDSSREDEPMPAELLSLVPGLRRIRRGESTSELLNRAVEAAGAELVALLDGDCAPDPGWLRVAVSTMRRHPEAVATSGRTTYPGRSFTNRVLALLSRAYLDPGRSGPTRFVSSNNAIFRRAALLAHPLVGSPRAMSARLQTEAIRLDGGELRFEPAMRVVHRFDGWPMERRIRRHVGYRAIRVRQLEPRLPLAWIARCGPLAVPLVFVLRVAESWRTCVRVGRTYGIRWFEVPAVLATAVGVHLLEIGGILTALGEARAERER